MPGWHRGVPGRLLTHPVQVMAQPCAQMPGDATVMGAARPLSGLSLAESKAFYTSKLQNTTLGVVGFMHVCIFRLLSDLPLNEPPPRHWENVITSPISHSISCLVISKKNNNNNNSVYHVDQSQERKEQMSRV